MHTMHKLSKKKQKCPLQCIADKHEFALNISVNKNENKIDSADKQHLINDESDVKIDESQDTPLKTHQKQSDITDIQRKKRKCIKQELNLADTEENIRIQRIKQVMDEERHLAIAKLRYEENINKIKEKHLIQLNEIEIQHKDEMNKLEIEINKTKLS